MALTTYRELRDWQLGIEIAKKCYALTKSFPTDELFGLTSQIRRASSAISANIAEGYGRGHKAEYVQFLRIARGSLMELETHLILSMEVGLASSELIDPVLKDCEDLGRMLHGHIRSLA